MGTAGGVIPTTTTHSPASSAGLFHSLSPNSKPQQTKQQKGKIMAIVLEANYSKKLGLPGYSSHQYSLTVRTELADLTQVAAESAKLHTTLQDSVDREIQKTGFLPESKAASPRGNGNGNGGGHANGNNDGWQCSPKQRELILKITDEHKLDKNAVEQLAQDRFGKNVKALNKLEASGLIDELLEQVGQKPNSGRRFNRPTPARAS
jgi:hypothetical protein